MARVFISYSRTDLALATTVHNWLVDAGHAVFLDRDLDDGIRPGEAWQERLHERLRWADAVVCLVSQASIASTWCVCEVATALSIGRWIIPLQVESAEPHPLLSQLQHLPLDQEARVRLVEELRVVDAGGGPGWPDDRSPFPGLHPFDVDYSQVFFGRSREVGELAALLRSPAERVTAGALLVVGPSGCGKSSLLRAGLMPAMTADRGWWALRPILPGRHPTAALARELTRALRAVGQEAELAQVQHRLEQGELAAVVDELLLAAPGGSRTRLLVPIDQFEELVTQASLMERMTFARLVRPAQRDSVQVVATLRPEFLDALLQTPESLMLELDRRPFTVRPLSRDALPQVIEGPARVAGMDIDDGLVARLVADTEGGEALPLLAYTLAQLVEGVERGGRLLRSRYDQLGGVQGTLARQAESAMTDATAVRGRGRDAVLRELLRLVTVDEHGRPTRWRIRRSTLPQPVREELAPFVTRRLLTTDLDNGTDVIGVAHEAFLSAWPPLAEMIAGNVAGLRAGRRIEQAATEWDDDQRAKRRLWTGDRLAAARVDIGAQFVGHSPDGSRLARFRRDRSGVTDNLPLPTVARQFLDASVRRDRFLRWRITVVLATLLVLALVAAGIAVAQLRVARQQQELAIAQYLMSQARETVSADPRTALRLAEAAYHLNPAPEAQETLVQLLTATRYLGTLSGHSNFVFAVAYSPDGRTLATAAADDTVFLWDVHDPNRPQRMGVPLVGHSASVNALAFSPDGSTLATGSSDLTTILWDVRDPRRPQRRGPPLLGHSKYVNAVAFSPDGRLLASAAADHTVLLWDVHDLTRPRPLGQPLASRSEYKSAVRFSPDGRILATGDDDTVILWDVRDPSRPHRLGQVVTSRANLVLSLAFSPDGHTLATCDFDTVTLWDVRDPGRPKRVGQPLTGHSGPVESVVFSPDGRTLATGSDDHAVFLWDVRDPSRAQRVGQPLIGHGGGVNAVAFSPDGHTLATGGNDDAVFLWDVRDPLRVAGPLTDDSGSLSEVAFSPDGNTLATGGRGRVLLWDVRDPGRPRQLGQTLTGQAGAAGVAAFSPDGNTLATASGGTILLLDVRDPRRPQLLGPPVTAPRNSVGALAFSPDGNTLAATDFDDVTLWDLHDVARPQRLGQPLPGLATGAVVFSPDGRTLATGVGNVVDLQDLHDLGRPRPLGEPLAGHSGLVFSVVFSPDGHVLATGSDDHTVLLWDVRDLGHPVLLGQPLTGHSGAVESMAFAPDGQTLATASGDHTVLLWDVRDPIRPRRLGQPLAGQSGSVISVAFSRDGHTMATGSDGTVLLWDIADLFFIRDHAADIACTRSGGGLDQEEWLRFVGSSPYEATCADL